MCVCDDSRRNGILFYMLYYSVTRAAIMCHHHHAEQKKKRRQNKKGKDISELGLNGNADQIIVNEEAFDVLIGKVAFLKSPISCFVRLAKVII